MRKTGRSSTTGQSPTPRLFFWISAGIIILLLGSAWLGQDGYLAVIVNKVRVSELKKEIAEIEAKNKELRSEIRSLRSDERAIEKIAREDLGLVKKGETVYEFIPSKK
ncbi:MAG: septum formation initiator family protein [Nitrospinae bacterium]|nr:septum formation initiator family protein [Nitrospinota bacterium]